MKIILFEPEVNFILTLQKKTTTEFENIKADVKQVRMVFKIFFGLLEDYCLTHKLRSETDTGKTNETVHCVGYRVLY